MSNKSKVSAKIPQIMNKNKNLAALISKLRTESETTSSNDKKAIMPGNLPAISESIKDKILNNETIVKLFPDIELSIQILVSSILAPNDMGMTNLIYNNDDNKIPSEIKIGILDTIKTYISTNYKIEDNLPIIVREAMFTKGAYIEAIIPEASIDAMINSDSTTTSLESFVDNNVNNKKLNILGPSEKTDSMEYSLEDMTLSLEADTKKTTTEKLKVSEEDLELEITDNFALLGINKRMSENVINKISTEMYKDDTISNEDLDEFDKLFRPMKDVKEESAITILTKDQIDRESIGKPLVIKLPVESVIPVHVTGDKTKHLGYFVLLNEKGNPINKSETIWDVNNGNLEEEMSKKAKSIIDKANNAINGFSKKDPTLDQMEEIYSHIVTAKIKKRISDGMLGDLAAIEEDNSDVYRIMMTRMLKKKKTKLLFIPSELVSYFAFKYRENGTGESLLENITVLSSIRAILLFARIMANVKNSVTTTEVSAQLDPDDIDPAKSMNKVISEVMKNRQTQLPIGVTRVEDLVDWTRKVGYKFNFKHESLPDMEISTSETNSSKVVPDSDLDEEIRKQILMAFALPPKAVEDGYDSDFATTIVQSNILFTKRVITHQDTLLPILTEHIKRIIKNDMKIYDLIHENIEANISSIKKYAKKTVENNDIDISKINDTKLSKWLTDEYIRSLEISLPRIEETKDDNMKEAFNNYKDSLDDMIEFFFSSDSVPEELVGMFGDKVENVQYAIKNTLIRKWMSDNNYIPELLEATSLDSDGKPIFDAFGEFGMYIENLEAILMPFLKDAKKKKDKRDAKVEKLDQEEEEEENNEPDEDTGEDNDLTGDEDDGLGETEDGEAEETDNLDDETEGDGEEGDEDLINNDDEDEETKKDEPEIPEFD